MRLISILNVAALLAVLAGTAHGQQAAAGLPNGAAVGISAAHLVYAEPLTSDGDRTITGPSVNVFWLTRSGLGFDAGFTYLPPTGFHELRGGVSDLGLTFAVRSGSTALLLRGGASGTAAGNTTGGYMAGAGAYGGLGVLTAVGDRLALRADVLGRSYFVGGAPGVLGVSAGVVLLPPRR